MTEDRAIRSRTTIRGDTQVVTDDVVACEEPLEIRLGGLPVAVVMRTPGHDLELVTGFLLSERIIEDASWIRGIHLCGDTGDVGIDHVARVTLHDPSQVDIRKLRRNFFSTSSCGVCGKATIEAIRASIPVGKRQRPVSLQSSVLLGLPEKLRENQPLFGETGGVHGVGLFGLDGNLRVVREDVGRHNALDKVIGWSARRSPGQGTSGSVNSDATEGQLLMLSGRISFEMVQKAAVAGIAVIAGVSAPTTLAVDLAHTLGITLVGFVRQNSMNVYTGRVDEM